MFWVPVIFLCTMQGDCAFMYDDGQTTKAQCEKMLSATLKRIKNDTNFRLSDGVCLDISAPKI